jgi:hypothetical protein
MSAIAVTGDQVRITIRWNRILVQRGRKSVLLLDPVEARELGADLILAAEALLATANPATSDPGLRP